MKLSPMNQLFEQWLHFRSAVIEPESVYKYRSMLVSFFKRFKDKRANELTPEDITGWIAYSMRTERLNPNHMINKITILRSWLEWCVDQGWAVTNPALAKKLPRLVHAEIQKHPFTWEQYYRLMRNISEVNYIKYADIWRVACPLAWYTGMRMGDCASLTWEGINFDDRMITCWPRKKRARRQCLTIPIEPELYEILLARRNVAKPSTNYVYYEFYALYKVYRRVLSWEFRYLCDSVGLPNLSFHSFRHGFVTRLLNAGVDPITIASLTGQSLAVLQGYAHISDQAKSNALEKGRDMTKPPEDQTKIEVAI